MVCRAYEQQIGLIRRQNEEKSEYSLDLSEKTDLLATEIEDLLKKHFDDLEFDFILDELSKVGQAPCLIYDDNGFWAISGSGFSTVSFGEKPMNFEISNFVSSDLFKDSPREALRYYMFNEDEKDKDD